MLPLLAIGVGLSAVGAATSLFGGMSSAQAQQQANEQYIGIQRQQEEVRRQAMRLDADRRRRQLIRDAIIARSTALARGTSQGASSQGSSALPGAYGQIAGRTGFAISGINSQEKFGEQLFDLNIQALAAKQAYSSAQSQGQMWNSIGSGLSSLGGALMGNAGTMGNIFGNFTGGGRGGGYNLGFANPNAGGYGILGVGPYG